MCYPIIFNVKYFDSHIKLSFDSFISEPVPLRNSLRNATFLNFELPGGRYSRLQETVMFFLIKSNLSVA
jgi:hypothetical protein